MILRGPGSNMNDGTPGWRVYHIVCVSQFDFFFFLHTLKFFLSRRVRASVTLNISSLPLIGPGADCACYHTQRQATEIIASLPRWADSFFRQIYYQMVQLKDAAQLSIVFMMIFFKTSPSGFAGPPENTGTSRADHFPILPSSPCGNKLKHKPCPPHFSWMPSRSSPYLTEPLSKLELCQYISSMVRRSFQNK